MQRSPVHDIAVTAHARRISCVFGRLLVVWALAVLIGWTTQTEALVAPSQVSPPAKPITALLLLLLGLVVVESCRRRRSLHNTLFRIVGALLVATGGLSLIEDIRGWPTSAFDSLLLSGSPSFGTDTASGRPAPLAAMALVLLGGALLLPPAMRMCRDVLCASTAAVGALAIVGRSLQVDSFYRVGDTYSLPLEVAVALLVAVIAVVGLLPREETEIQRLLDQSIAGTYTRRILAVLLVPPIGGGLIRRALDAAGLQSADTGAAVIAVGVAVASALAWQAGRWIEEADADRAAELRRFSLAHADLKQVCHGVARGTGKLKPSALAAQAMPSAAVRSVAQAFVDLQEERHAADYDHQDTFDAKRLRVAIATSKKAITALESLKNDQATCAFFSLLALRSSWLSS